MKKRRLIKTGCRAFPGLRHAAGPSRAQRAALAPLAAQPDDEASQILDFPDILAAVSVVQYDKRAPARREAS
jgi:hypothetical protein